MVDARPTAISLFSGTGMLDEGVRLALGGRLRTVGFVERDAHAAAILMARMEDEALEPAPVYCGDVCDIDWSPWAGAVDCVIAGFPCQDLSVAGKRAGIYGKRSGLWGEVVRAARELRAGYIFAENVPGLLAHGAMRRVLGDLAALGFDVEWGSLRASAVGAPHRRERVFIVAHDARHGRHQGREQRRPDVAECGGAVDDANSAQRRPKDKGRGSGQRIATGWTGRNVDDARSQRRPQGLSRCRPAARTTGRGSGAALFPPGPADADAWADVLADYPHLAPALDPEEAEPAVRGMADGLASILGSGRADALRAVGNGVVALQAGVAVRCLLRRLHGGIGDAVPVWRTDEAQGMGYRAGGGVRGVRACAADADA